MISFLRKKVFFKKGHWFVDRQYKAAVSDNYFISRHGFRTYGKTKYHYENTYLIIRTRQKIKLKKELYLIICHTCIIKKL